MSANIITTTELIAVISLYCIAFCPVLCWILGGKPTPAAMTPVPLIKTSTPLLK